MSREESFRFTFVSKALSEDTFTVAEFKGSEGVSMLYEFEILLYSDDPEIDLKAVLQNQATLTIIPEGGDERKIHGIPARFEQLQEHDDYIYYRLKLVPRYWLADQYHENMLFLEKSVPDIIEEVLKQSGLTSQDYELKLTSSYKPWEYVCQYNETDFNFLSRWMEREGIYYYFDQSGDAEKLIITDSSTAHQPIEGAPVTYSPRGEATPSVYEQVMEFACRQQILPKKVILKDYNYRKPSLDLKGEADVDTGGRGNVYIYGEHFKTPEEGNSLAKIRAEELLCREAVFYGESTVSPFVAGYLFELEEHYRESYNQKYLLTEITHQGVQDEFLAMSADTSRITDLEGPAYINRFGCILESVQYRPERTADKSRIDGTLNAKVDAAGDGQYAEIDEEGRYKVILPFDQSGNSDGKASRWVRMAQPYAGADYGMHFPLHKGIEVLLTFVDGDPDRPIIAGSVPNPETGSPVKGGNQSQSVIRTGGGNQIRIEDSEGGQQIHLSSPTEGSIISLGAPNQGNIFMNTTGNIVRHVVGPEEIKQLGNTVRHFGGEFTEDVDGTFKVTYRSDVLRTTMGTTNELFIGSKTSKTVASTDETFVGAKNTANLGAFKELTVGAKYSENASVTVELFGGAKSSSVGGIANDNFAGLKVSTAAGASISKSAVKNLSEAPLNEIKGEAGVKISCGGSSIDLTPGGITIKSPKIDIKGGLVRLYGNIQNKDGLKSNKDSFFDKAIYAKNLTSL